MTQTRRAVLATGASAALASLAGCASNSNDAEATVTDEYRADDVDRLKADSRNGEIQVRGADRDTIALTGTKRAPDEDALEDITVETSQTDGALVIEVVHDDSGGLLSIFESTPTVDLELAVPESQLDVEADTTNGDVTVREIEGSVTAETTNGDVSVTALEGPVTADTTNGDITVDSPNAVDVSVETTNGDVELRVPETIEAELSLQTTNGDLDVENLDGSTLSSEDDIETTIGDGSYRIECETTNGDVLVRGQS